MIVMLTHSVCNGCIAVELDLLEDKINEMNEKVMIVKNWKELALNRKAWNDLVEKAKTHEV